MADFLASTLWIEDAFFFCFDPPSVRACRQGMHRRRRAATEGEGWMSLPTALPSLRGKRGSVVHVVYYVLAMVVLTMTVGSAIFAGLGYFRDAPAAAHYGFWLGSDDNGNPTIFEATTADAAQRTIDRHDPLFPLRVPLNADGVGAVGWMLFGPRPDGSLYGKEERETLTVIAGPVARAIAIAIERDRRDTDLRAELSRHRRLIDQLVDWLGAFEDRARGGRSPDAAT